MASEIVKTGESHLVPMADIEKMGAAIAKSGLFGIKTVEQAVALMLVAQAEGRHPATVAREYDIIQGRPALKAEAKLARFQEAGGVIQWEEMGDKRCAAFFSHPSFCPKPVLIEWTIEQARAADLAGKDNWKKYARAMLRSRVISEGVRAVAPGSSLGMYTPEEVMDFTPAEAKNVTPAKAFKQISQTAPAPEPEVVEPEILPPAEPEPSPAEEPPKKVLTPEEIAARSGGKVVSKAAAGGERLATENQCKCIHAMAGTLKIPKDKLTADLQGTYGTPHTHELTFKQASSYIDGLKGMLTAQGK